MPYIQKPDERKNDNTKIVNARVSEDVLKALSMADDDSNQFDYSFSLTGVIKKALDDTLIEIHQTTGIDYYKLIKWEKKIKDRFETDAIQSLVADDRYDNWLPPWIVEVGSAFNLIFKNYSTLEVPNIAASDSVSYINPNASAREKDYFNNHVLFRKMQVNCLKKQSKGLINKISFIDHHTCHAYYAAFAPNIKESRSAILTVDSEGDGLNQTFWIFDKKAILSLVPTPSELETSTGLS